MRKLPLLLAGALAFALGVAGIAQAVQSTQNMKVSLQKNKAGTKKKPRNVGKLTVDLSITVNPADPPFATRTTVLFFDKNLVFNGKKFPSCTETEVYNSQGATLPKCKKARIGGGQAQGLALGQQQALTVNAYNGPRGRTILLRVKGATPLDIDQVIVGKLQTAGGQFGKKLVVPIPDKLQQPLTGVFATLTRFMTTVGGTAGRTRVPYVALKGCTKGGLKFKGDFTFTDGTTQSPATTAPCRR